MTSLGKWHSDKEADGQDEGQNSAAARWGPSPGRLEENSGEENSHAHLLTSLLPPNPNGGQGCGLLDLRHP